MTDAMDNLEELLRLSGGDGQIFTMEGPLCMKSAQAMFGYDLLQLQQMLLPLTNSLIVFIWGALCLCDACCLQEADRPGVLSLPRRPTLWEPVLGRPGLPSARASVGGWRGGANAQNSQHRYRTRYKKMTKLSRFLSYKVLILFFCASDLEIVGFIEIADISSPPVISRHLILPIAVNKGLYEMPLPLFYFTLVDQFNSVPRRLHSRGGWSRHRSHRGAWGGSLCQSNGRQKSKFLRPFTWQLESWGDGGPGAAGVRWLRVVCVQNLEHFNFLSPLIKMSWPKSFFSLLISRPDWYGMLHSQADSKKKSNLMMSLFEPGPEPLPWLGKISHLGPISGKPPTLHPSKWVHIHLSWTLWSAGVFLSRIVIRCVPTTRRV